MTISTNDFKKNLPFIIFYILFLIVGVSTYSDYGISWDEVACRQENGLQSWAYFETGNIQYLLKNDSKYHGPVFEIFLVFIERTFNITDIRTVFLVRHLFNFLVFALSVFFFYKICLRYLKSHALALTGAVILVLSPRIYADAFYNNKDLIFTSMVIINIYTTLRYLESKNIYRAIINGIITAIVIDVRILGIIIPCFTFLLLLIDYIKKSEERKRIIISSAAYIVFLISSMIFLWPVLWLGPIDHFLLALKEMSLYPWNGPMLYNGALENSMKLPWHYLFVWMIITTPVLYTLLFLGGIIIITARFINKKFPDRFEWFNLYIFLVPLLAILIMHSVVYDAWRHVFFIYPSFILIALSGLKYVTGRINKFRYAGYTISIIVVMNSIYVAYNMYKLHPYETLYFNKLAGNSLAEIKPKFELDYWGLSYKEGIEYILQSDTSGLIPIFVYESPGIDNLNMFEEKDRKRIMYSDSLHADYILTCFRYRRDPFPVEPVFNVVRDNGVILSVVDNRHKYSQICNQYYHQQYLNQYDSPGSNWVTGKIINTQQAISGDKVEMVDSSVHTSSVLIVQPGCELTRHSSSKKYIMVNVELKTATSLNENIVIQINHANGVCYGWLTNPIVTLPLNSWTHQEFKILLPEITSVKDEIKVYVSNINRQEYFLDDFKVDFYSIPANYPDTLAETIN